MQAQAHSRLRSQVSSACGAASCGPHSQALRSPPRSRRVNAVLCLRQAAPTNGVKVKLSFKLPYRCSFGQELAIVGSGETLGNWDVDHAKRMEWTDGDVWTVQFEVSAGPQVEMEYKYVVRNCDGGVLCWKPGSNYQIKVPVLLEREKAIAEGVLVRDAWDGSIQDIQLETSGLMGHQFTEEEEMAAVQSAMDRALEGLSNAMTVSNDIQDKLKDPTAPEVLQADRLVAAAARKAVAMHRALNASQAYSSLPVPSTEETAA